MFKMIALSDAGISIVQSCPHADNAYNSYSIRILNDKDSNGACSSVIHSEYTCLDACEIVYKRLCSQYDTRDKALKYYRILVGAQ